MLYRDQTLGLSTQYVSSNNTRAAARLEKVRVLLTHDSRKMLKLLSKTELFKDIFSLN